MNVVDSQIKQLKYYTFQVLSLLILILTSASRYTENFGYTDRDGNAEIVPTQQMTYVNFVGSFCCITLLISMIIYLLKLYNLPLCGKLPWGKMVSVCFYHKFDCCVLDFEKVVLRLFYACFTNHRAHFKSFFFSKIDRMFYEPARLCMNQVVLYALLPLKYLFLLNELYAITR